MKLHQDGLIHSFGLQSFETCESCLLVKMTKDPFTGHNERASDLLSLIHTYVCGQISSQPIVESTSSGQGPRRSSRIHHEPKRYGFLVTDNKTIELVDQDEPTTYHEAMMSLDSVFLNGKFTRGCVHDITRGFCRS